MINVDIQVTRNKLKAQETNQKFYLLAKVTPPNNFIIARMPLNIALVIDRSTSMKGKRLDQVKRAASLLIDKLSNEDVISIISYSDRAEIILPASRIVNKAPVMARIRGMTASGGTEIYQGLKVAIKEMQKASLISHLNHLILLTDGHTYGDEEACKNLAKTASLQKIGLSAFGIGHEWNDQFLDQLVSSSGGQSDYIENPEQIVEYLQQRIHNLGAVYAYNVRLDIQNFPKGVSLNYGLKLKPFSQPLMGENGQLILGTMEGTTALMFLLEFDISAQIAGTTLNIPLNFSADIPSSNLDNETYSFYLDLPIVKQIEDFQPNRILIEAVRILNIYRMNETAWQEAERGNIEAATKRMQRLTTRLLEAGFTKLATQAHLETERLDMMGSLSEDGRKKLKYGTRALLSTVTLDGIND